MTAPENALIPHGVASDTAALDSMQEISTGFRVYLWFSAIAGFVYFHRRHQQEAKRAAQSR